MSRYLLLRTLAYPVQEPAQGGLSKADREKIDDYYNAGAKGVDGIKHLLVG